MVFGSGSIASLLTEHDLVDEYQLIVNPILLGGGQSLMRGVSAPRKVRADRVDDVSVRQREAAVRGEALRTWNGSMGSEVQWFSGCSFEGSRGSKGSAVAWFGAVGWFGLNLHPTDVEHP